MVLIAVERAWESTICGIPLADAMIVTIPAGTAVTASVKPGLRYAGAVVPTALWEEIQAVAVGAVVAQATDRPSAVRLAADHARTIRHQFGRTADRLAATPVDQLHLGHPHAAFTEYLGSLAEARAVAEDRDPGIDQSARRRLRQAWMAQDFIHAHIREDMPIIRLCREVGVSRRQLEYAFRTTFAVSPRAFVQALRLNEARRQLATARANGLTVTQVAMETGINHLGRFAASYRLLFGESPRDTFSRAERPRGPREGHRMRSRDQQQALHAGIRRLADDDVVVDGNAERLGRVDDQPGHLDVGARRCRVA